MLFLTIIYIAVAYLVGSFCSAIIVCRLFNLPNPCTHGSNNPGATNVLRLAGKKYAIIVLIVDMLKGLLPVLLAKNLGAGPSALGFVCLAAVLGHMYPLFFKFKGGKGVATTLGALFGFKLSMGTVIVATWLMVAYLSGFSSLASLIAIIFAPFYSVMLLHGLSAFFPLMLITVLVVYQHLNNIYRLMDGTEPQINLNKKIEKEE